MPLTGQILGVGELYFFFGTSLLIAILLWIFPIKKGNEYEDTPVFSQILTIFLYFLSVIFSVSVAASFQHFFIFANILLVFNLVTRNIKKNNFLNGFTIALFIYVILTLGLSQLSGVKYLANSDNIFSKVYGHRLVANILVFAIPLFIIRVNYHKVLSFVGIPLSLAAIYITSSRSAIISVIFSVLIIFITNKSKPVLKLFVLITAFYVCIALFAKTDAQKTSGGSRLMYWKTAVSGFSRNPLLGNGPGTFYVQHLRFREAAIPTTTNAHSILFELLSSNGLPFTILALFLVVTGLIHQYRHNSTLFVLGSTSLFHALFDSTWASPGVIVLSLVIIFYGIKRKTGYVLSKTWIMVLIVITLIYLITNLLSDYYAAKSNHKLSYVFRPDSVVTARKYFSDNSDLILNFFGEDTTFLRQKATLQELPNNLSSFNKLFELDPLGTTNEYVALSFYYDTNQKWKDLEALIYDRDKFFYKDTSQNQRIILARASYHLALHLWDQRDFEKSIKFFQKAVDYSQNRSHFHIELASAFWHQGQKAKAETQLLSVCSKTQPSAKHCKEFYDEKKYEGLPLPGYHLETINKLNI